jgi:adenylate cyclase
MIEIERKFLLRDKTILKYCDDKSEIIQFYITDNLRFRKDKDGLRFELKRRKDNYNIENHLKLNNFLGLFLFWLFNKTIKRKIHKIRHILKTNESIYEIDEFLNKDLFLVEIEFPSIEIMDDYIEKPNWLGMDVTDNPNYFNSNISKN